MMFTTKEKIEITIQSGLELIPYVGGALSSVYFATKQEKRFKRLESFYQQFAVQVEQSQHKLLPIEVHDPEALTALLEELNEEVECEHTAQKRAYFRKYLLSTLISPTDDKNFDERRFFLDALSKMTLLECGLLIYLHQKKNPVKTGNINIPNVSQYAIIGALGRLKMYGLIRATVAAFSIGDGSDNALDELVSLSDFGIRFIHYSLE